MYPQRSNCIKNTEKNKTNSKKIYSSLPYLHLGEQFTQTVLSPKNTINETQCTDTAIIAWNSQKNGKKPTPAYPICLGGGHNVPTKK